MAEIKEMEKWSNATNGIVYITKRNLYGNVTSEGILPGQTISLTTEDRMVNQESAATTKQDLFKNGTLASVMLVESAADYEEVASNPNSMSDDELSGLFSQKIGAFRSSLEDIENVRVVQRLIKFTDQADINASLAQSKALESRLNELNSSDVKKFEDATGDIPVKDLS